METLSDSEKIQLSLVHSIFFLVSYGLESHSNSGERITDISFIDPLVETSPIQGLEFTQLLHMGAGPGQRRK